MQCGGAAGDAQDIRTVVEELLAKRRSDAARCAGDEEGSAFEWDHSGNFKL
jgi:hypothetical protein